MAIAKVFRRGNFQAVRIPRSFRLRSNEVEIFRRGNELVLREQPQSLSDAFRLLTELSADFFKGGRRQPKLGRRRKF